MNEVDFRNWFTKKGLHRKVVCDLVCRLKRMEKDMNFFDVDLEYKKDKCERILALFQKKGLNEDMQKLNCKIPTGKYQFYTYKYALNKYIAFLEETTESNQ